MSYVFVLLWYLCFALSHTILYFFVPLILFLFIFFNLFSRSNDLFSLCLILFYCLFPYYVVLLF
jgi:hypothetical protein